MSTTSLPSLREAWQACQDRILALSQLRGQDHTSVAISIAQEIRLRESIKRQILRAQERADV